MMVKTTVSGGLAVLFQHLAMPANGYIIVPPSPFSSRSAFIAVGQTSTIHHPRSIIRRPLFAAPAATADADLYNSTGTQDNSLVGVGDASYSPPAALGTSGDWAAYLDETKGLIYYFNQRTGESKWEPPEDADFSNVQMKIGAAKKVEMRERLKRYLEERLNDSAAEFTGTMQQESVMKEEKKPEKVQAKPTTIKEPEKVVESTKKKVPSEDTRNKDVVSEWGQWQALIDNKRGQIYYFNKNTRESSWDRPDGFPSFKLSASKKIALEEQNKRYLEWHKGAAKVSVLGKGKVVISDSNFDDEAKEMNSDKEMAELAEEKIANNLPGINDGKEEPNGTEAITGEGPDAFSIENQPTTLPIVQQGEWSAYFDIKSGLVFYFNEENGTTSWDPPFMDFPRIVMEKNKPKVLDPGSGNISMERALGYIGVDEMSEALAWEEAKKKERARKAAIRAKKAKENEGTATSELYEAAKEAELERIVEDRKLDEQKAKNEAAAKLAEKERQRLEQEQMKAEAAANLALQEKLEQERREKDRLEQERLAAEVEAERERRVAAMLAEKERERLKLEQAEAEAAAKLAIEKKIEQDRLEKERLEQEQIAAKEREASAKRAIQEKLNQERIEKEPELKQPAAPKGKPTITVETVETMVAPLKTRTLYDILQCSSTASRIELKRSYLSLAKETHPDALLQNGMVTNDATERRFVEISQAWKILGDTTSRRRYDRELAAKGISSKAGNIFENWVIGAAKAMDEALAKAEDGLESGDGKKP